MEILATALALGLMGSFHCAGMCGPIAISLPLHGNKYYQKVIGGILYNLGRTVTYGIMGAIFGLIGQSFQLMGFQQWVSIVMGSLMVLSVLVPSVFRKINTGHKMPLAGYVRSGMQRLFQKKSFGGLFFIGLLNGLLPCGLVYMAIAGAIGTSDVLLGIAFMVLFGLGTLPMMLVLSLVGNMVTISVRNKINRLIPVVVVVIGILFILRGLSLGIPYISPPRDKLSPEKHMTPMDTLHIKDRVHGSCCGSN